MNPLIAAIMQHLHGGAPAPGQPAPAMAQAQAPGSESQETPAQNHQAVSILQQMIQLGHEYVRVEPDPEDKQTMFKVLTTLQGYLANEQKQRDQALGTSAQVKYLRRGRQ